MRRLTYTSESTANATKTHILNIPGKTKWVDVKSLTISTRGADVAADISITIQDDGAPRWKVWLRSAQIFGGHFPNIGVIPLSSGKMKIVTAAGGSGVIVTVSCVYKCFKDIEI